MVNRIKIHLDKKFITTKLDADTILKVKANGDHPSILHRLYLITNEIKELQYFMELDHPVYQCSAVLQTNYAYAGGAKEQASALGILSDKINQRHSYTFKFSIYEKVGMREIFYFTHTTTSEAEVLSTINKLETKAKELCQNKVDTY